MAASMCDMFSFCVGAAGLARGPVEVRFVSSAKGKGLFATRPVQKGETIFVERPLVASQFLWNALYRYRGKLRACVRACGGATLGTLRLWRQCPDWNPEPGADDPFPQTGSLSVVTSEGGRGREVDSALLSDWVTS
uniref:SET domain-containing protein n=1 Tax=Monodelphis domestica TaxID=13616 RepID=A0A5F8H6R0_MONDO